MKKFRVTHHSLLLGVSLFVLGTVVFAGYKIYQNRPSAKAAFLVSFSGYDTTKTTFYGCKVAINSAYGPLYQLQIKSATDKNWTKNQVTTTAAIVRSQGTLAGKAYAGGTIHTKSWVLNPGDMSSIVTVYSSRLLNDNIVTTVKDNKTGVIQSHVTAPSSLSGC